MLGFIRKKKEPKVAELSKTGIEEQIERLEMKLNAMSEEGMKTQYEPTVAKLERLYNLKLKIDESERNERKSQKEEEREVRKEHRAWIQVGLDFLKAAGAVIVVGGGLILAYRTDKSEDVVENRETQKFVTKTIPRIF